MVEYEAKKEEAAKAIERSAGAIQDMAEHIRSFNVNEYRDRVMDKVDDVRAEVDKDIDNVKANIRDHPFESVAIAAGAGIMVGALIALAGRRAAKRAARV